MELRPERLRLRSWEESDAADLMEAYNKKLVKRIAVKGISESGTTATDSYVYLEGINRSKEDPTATIQFHSKEKCGIRIITKNVNIGFNLFIQSGELEEYRDHFIVRAIDGRDDSIEFQNGIRMCAGDVIGKVNQEQIRRIQIRETILSHIERERDLFPRGIKVLSLFFVDEAESYRTYDDSGNPVKGKFADIFERQYEDILRNFQLETGEEDYGKYLDSIDARKTHAGYFSMETSSVDLDCHPGKSPVRFVFSHSALGEGWDHSNIFQICMLKQSGSDIRKCREVACGMGLCVNKDGERMDENALGNDVHRVNVLTVIAGDSYDRFVRELQSEMAEAVAEGSSQVTEVLCGDAGGHDPKEHEEAQDKNHVLTNQEINVKTSDAADYAAGELVKKSVAALDSKLRVTKIFFKVETGAMKDIISREDLMAGTAFMRGEARVCRQTHVAVNSSIKYDLVGKIVKETGLTRKAVVQILTGIQPTVFHQFKDNPEEFIMKAAALIGEVLGQ